MSEGDIHDVLNCIVTQELALKNINEVNIVGLTQNLFSIHNSRHLFNKFYEQLDYLFVLKGASQQARQVVNVI